MGAGHHGGSIPLIPTKKRENMAEKIFLAGGSSMYRERNSTKVMMCVAGKDYLSINGISEQILVLKGLIEELDRFSKLEE